MSQQQQGHGLKKCNLIWRSLHSTGRQGFPGPHRQGEFVVQVSAVIEQLHTGDHRKDVEGLRRLRLYITLSCDISDAKLFRVISDIPYKSSKGGNHGVPAVLDVMRHSKWIREYMRNKSFIQSNAGDNDCLPVQKSSTAQPNRSIAVTISSLLGNAKVIR